MSLNKSYLSRYLAHYIHIAQKTYLLVFHRKRLTIHHQLSLSSTLPPPTGIYVFCRYINKTTCYVIQTHSIFFIKRTLPPKNKNTPQPIKITHTPKTQPILYTLPNIDELSTQPYTPPINFKHPHKHNKHTPQTTNQTSTQYQKTHTKPTPTTTYTKHTQTTLHLTQTIPNTTHTTYTVKNTTNYINPSNNTTPPKSKNQHHTTHKVKRYKITNPSKQTTCHHGIQNPSTHPYQHIKPTTKYVITYYTKLTSLPTKHIPNKQTYTKPPNHLKWTRPIGLATTKHQNITTTQNQKTPPKKAQPPNHISSKHNNNKNTRVQAW